MSKSNDNYIGFTDTPEDMFGKVLSIPDELILKYYEYCTGSSTDDFYNFKNRFNNANPRDMKRELACKIIESYHSSEDSQKAMEHFDQVFVKKAIPDNIDEYKITEPERLLDILSKNTKIVSHAVKFVQSCKKDLI